MENITVPAYTFSELSDKAKDKAREYYKSVYMSDGYWYEFVIENAKEIGALLGLDIENVHFSGFWSQGDGACWTGGYRCAEVSPAKVAAIAGRDSELIRIARGLQDIQRENSYQLIATANRRPGMYYHSHTMCADVEDRTCPSRDVSDAERDLLKLFRDFADWIYSNLEKEYEYQTSDEAIKDAFDENETLFFSNGDIVHWAVR